MDLLHANNSEYLLQVDCFSSYFFIHKLRQLTSAEIIKHFDKIQLRYGYVKAVLTDGGSQFSSAAFRSYCSNKNIYHRLSSPTFSRSNGQAEASVQRSKYLLLKCKLNDQDLQVQLLHYFNAPLAHNRKSPAELFFNRKLRAPGLPRAPFSFFLPQRDVDKTSKFKIGDKVLLQCSKTKRWKERGEIIDIRRSKKSYNILMEDGRTIIRNEHYLRRI